MMTGGKRESEWLGIRRCLAIVRRLQHGPAKKDELIKAVLTDVDDEAYSPHPKARYSAFRRDIENINQRLEITVKADPSTKAYHLLESTYPLLSLPDDDLGTLAWLEQTFSPGTPNHKAIQQLVQQLQHYLSEPQRLSLSQQYAHYTLMLGQQDDDTIDPQVELKLREALARRLRIELDYLSPQNATGRPVRHVVDVFEPPRFEPALGHYYLSGWCHYLDGPEGRFEQRHYIPYRLGRIKVVRLLSQKLTTPPRARRHRVEYQLSARVARQGVTRRRWIDIESTQPQPDESVLVSGHTDNLFFALQELMHYRYHCRVLGGPELLKMMQETVEKMASLYQQSDKSN